MARPSAAVLDAHTVTPSEGGEQVGHDVAKRVRDRKRHLLVDTLGLLLAVAVTTARLQDRPGGQALLTIARATLSAAGPRPGRRW